MKLLSRYTLSLFDWVLIIGTITFNILYNVLSGGFDVIGSLASVTGVACVVLVAKRSISNYIFGLINVSLYAYISYKSGLYGDFLLNAFYYLPMQFIGWAMWFKDKGDLNVKGQLDMSLVKSRFMGNKDRLFLAAICLCSTIIGGYILQKFTTDPQPYKDSATTILSVIAMFLMVKKYMEQWILWAIVNVISVVMWIILWFSGGEHAGLMVIMYLFYFANSTNGIIVWSNAAATSDAIKR